MELKVSHPFDSIREPLFEDLSMLTMYNTGGKESARPPGDSVTQYT
jgi:hypothetical protein